MSTIRIAVVQAGLGTPSTTSRLADVLQERVVRAVEADASSADVTRITLRELAVAVAEATVSGIQAPKLEAALASLTDADVIIAVSPIFNASYSGIFKGFFDLVEPKAIAGTPVILGATGGTARHSLVIEMAMRPLFSYLRAMPVPTSIFASADDFAGSSSIGARAELIAAEALALVNARQSVAARLAGELDARDSRPTPDRTDIEADTFAGPGGPDPSEEPDSLDSAVGEFVPFSHFARRMSHPPQQ